MESTGDMDRSEEIPIIPEALSVHFDEIPDDLKEYPFVFWKYEIVEKYVKKPPFNPRTGKRASVADPGTWGSFTEAREAYLTQKWGKADGVGIMLPENGNLVAVDIDDCIKNGKISASAMDIISLLDSYTEYSPSIPEGAQMPTGVHVWMKGKLPGLFCRNDEKRVEIYERRRYMTITGHPIHTNSGLISADQDRLSAVYNELFAYAEGERDTGGGLGEVCLGTMRMSPMNGHLQGQKGQIMAVFSEDFMKAMRHCGKDQEPDTPASQMRILSLLSICCE